MRARSLAGFAALALAIAAASSAHAADLYTPPMALDDDGRFGPTGAAIDVVLDKSTVKYLAPDITANIAHGDCDSCLGYQGGGHAQGLSDFRIDADGYLFILDGINNKILILDDRLRFHRAIQLDGHLESFGEIGSLIYVKMMEHDNHRIVDRRQGTITRFDPVSAQTTSDPVLLRVIRRPSHYVVRGKRDGPVGDVTTCNIRYPGTFYSGHLMSDRMVDGIINFRIDYVRSANPFHATSILYRIHVSGDIAAIDLSPAYETIYRPSFSSRCGPDNTVIAVDVTDTMT
ncbi:MAG: hypothetical protein Q7W56_12320, partial [Candidatus Latescibacteria bacterium]|nr:hypothetical protein [Candidatus Latescibacterota bacterium]